VIDVSCVLAYMWALYCSMWTAAGSWAIDVLRGLYVHTWAGAACLIVMDTRRERASAFCGSTSTFVH